MSDSPIEPLTQQALPNGGDQTGHSAPAEYPAASVAPPSSQGPPGLPDAVEGPEPATAGQASAVEAAAPPPPAPLFTIHDGRVVRVTAEEVVVTLEDERQGIVPLIEFVGQPLPKDGDRVSVIIEKEDAHTGKITLSKRHADEMTFWQSVTPGDMLEGVVTGMNKGGLDIDIGGARAFLPASQVDVHRMKDISTLIGEHIRCIVVQVDRTTCDLIVSRKKYIEEELHKQHQEAVAKLSEGDTLSGTVTSITKYGAFIDMGGVDGLLHMADISWGRVRDPKEVLQVGQPIRVRILKINHETGKVSLGLKQLKPNPWEGIDERYIRDKRIKARVARMTDFGAFLELEEGVDALLPISEMSWSRHIAHPSEVVNIGDEIEVAVLKVDAAKQRISVGLKQTQENPWSTVETRFPVNAKVPGKVLKLAEFGAFVELVPGVEGLIHISELSDKRVRTVSEVVQEGQQIEVRVIKVDMANQRISLSMRPEPKLQPRMAEASSAAAKGKKQQKKRPLRGGLSSHFDW